MSENSKGQNRNEQESKKGMHSTDNDLRDFGGSENASASRGGTTDLDQDSLTVDKVAGGARGSGATTKRNVTGSDFDGQVSGE